MCQHRQPGPPVEAAAAGHVLPGLGQPDGRRLDRQQLVLLGRLPGNHLPLQLEGSIGQSCLQDHPLDSAEQASRHRARPERGLHVLQRVGHRHRQAGEGQPRRGPALRAHRHQDRLPLRHHR